MESVIEQLTRLGFTRYEAQAYAALLGESPQNGYELARTSGVPRPNIYAVLDRLEERGAVMRVEEGGATRFVPIASEELLRRQRDAFENTLKEAEASLREIEETVRWEPVANIRGRQAVVRLAKGLIASSKRELLLAIWPQEAPIIEADVAEAEAKGVTVTTLCLAGCPQPCGHCHGKVYPHRVEAPKDRRWLVLTADASDMFAAEFAPGNDALGVRTRQRLLVELASWYVRHTIAVASLIKDIYDTDAEVLSPETRDILRSIGSYESGHDWLKQMHDILAAGGY